MALMFVAAIAEVVSLGAVLPFVAVLANPAIVWRYPLVAHLARSFGIVSAGGLVLPLTAAFVLTAVLAGTVRVVLLWVNTRFTFAAGADLSREVYRKTLYQPYAVHLTLSSSEVISGIANKVGGTVLGVLLPALTLMSSIVLLSAIMAALIAVNPLVALIATAGFGGGYALITWISRRRLKQNSEHISREQTQLIKALQEGLGGIRDVLLDGTQPIYCEIYNRADQSLRRALGDNVFIAQSPRFAIEALGMVLIATIAYVLSRHFGGVSTALPLLAALALGSQRTLPALQQAYSAWATIAGSYGSLADTVELLDQKLPDEVFLPAPDPLPLRDSIQFDEIRFRYGPDGPWVLDGFDLTIRKGERVGLVGSTGSGKSTALDLLMGLLTPCEGRLLVDHEPLTGRRVRAWQRSIAHVPQSIYLADSTITENIAFGLPQMMIDQQRVRDAARRANIDGFIESRPEKYDEMVGERGVRLSGGQRQRIGIARALYKQAAILILDEATSALDNATEQSVMDAIDGISRDVTVLVIAHRLSTVERCDKIVEIAHGRVKAQGTFEQLIACSSTFRRMAQLTSIPG
ncbi:MAG TPA: ABC transporter ATP-binding protein [Steroidobacteraceae bacterium]|nr:ABC transporter ATP-binding protein [Steroidobacteraceae bacterium]